MIFLQLRTACTVWKGGHVIYTASCTTMTDEWIRSAPSDGFWSRQPPGDTLSDEDISGMTVPNQL